jgi:hypothetical protein
MVAICGPRGGASSSHLVLLVLTDINGEVQLRRNHMCRSKSSVFFYADGRGMCRKTSERSSGAANSYVLFIAVRKALRVH